MVIYTWYYRGTWYTSYRIRCHWNRLVEDFPKTYGSSSSLMLAALWLRSSRALKIGPKGVVWYLVLRPKKIYSFYGTPFTVLSTADDDKKCLPGTFLCGVMICTWYMTYNIATYTRGLEGYTMKEEKKSIIVFSTIRYSVQYIIRQSSSSIKNYVGTSWYNI